MGTLSIWWKIQIAGSLEDNKTRNTTLVCLTYLSLCYCCRHEHTAKEYNGQADCCTYCSKWTADVSSVISFLVFVFLSTCLFILFLLLIFRSFPYTCYSPTSVPLSYIPSSSFPPLLTFLFLLPFTSFFLYSLLFHSVPLILVSFFSFPSYWSHFFFSPILLFLQLLMVILPPPVSHPSLIGLV